MSPIHFTIFVTLLGPIAREFHLTCLIILLIHLTFATFVTTHDEGVARDMVDYLIDPLIH